MYVAAGTHCSFQHKGKIRGISGLVCVLVFGAICVLPIGCLPSALTDLISSCALGT